MAQYDKKRQLGVGKVNIDMIHGQAIIEPNILSHSGKESHKYPAFPKLNLLLPFFRFHFSKEILPYFNDILVIRIIYDKTNCTLLIS